MKIRSSGGDGCVAVVACLLAGCAGGDNPSPGAGAIDPSAGPRAAMVDTLRGYGVTDGRVLKAMAEVPRHEFVPEQVRHAAYADSPLPIGHGQTISQPYIVAFMTEQLKPSADDVVLEIGTGSGYQAAVLSPLVKHVYTIEIVEALAEGSRDTLARLGYDNVTVRHGDGYRGWPEHAPFDAVIVTCAPEEVPTPLVEQLRDGGRMIIPAGEAGDQKLYLLEKRSGKIEQRDVMDVRFVPMTGEAER